MAEVVLKNVSKSFGQETAVDDVSLVVPDGSFVVLLGPTGAGKTTTLRLIAGLEKLDQGDVSIDGVSVKDMTPAQRNVAMVFQQYSLYPHLTVRENLEFPLRSPILNLMEEEINEKVDSVAEVLQIKDKLQNRATELSGGEMQRVSIGRALVRNPSIYLMDEPLSSLDAKLRADLRVELKRIQSNLGATLLYVTHDQVEAMTMATQVGVLLDGKLVQYGTPREIYENPNSIYVASRLGLPRINLLPAEVFPGSKPGAATIGMRPEQIIQSEATNGSGKLAQVHRVEHLGDQTRLHLSLAGHDIITLADNDIDYQSDGEIRIAPKDPLYFDADGMRLA